MQIQKVPVLAALVLSLFFLFSFLTPGSGQAETGTKSMKKSSIQKIFSRAKQALPASRRIKRP